MTRRVWLFLLLTIGLLFSQQGVLRHSYTHDLGALRLIERAAADPAKSTTPEEPVANALCDLCLAYAQLAVTLPSQWAFDGSTHETPRERMAPALRPVSHIEVNASIRGPPLILSPSFRPASV